MPSSNITVCNGYDMVACMFFWLVLTWMYKWIVLRRSEPQKFETSITKLNTVSPRLNHTKMVQWPERLPTLPPTNKKIISGSSQHKSAGHPILDYVNENIIGKNKIIKGPFGPRTSVYCDYIASGRALQFIEDFIQDHVLPAYGNTHSTSTDYATQTTVFREEARDIIRKSVNANEQDACIFSGSGCTGAVHKLITALHLEKPPIVFCGPFEHHSNLLPWREIGDVINIQETADGLFDVKHLKQELEIYKDSGRPLIGSFGASSNITGVLVDIDKITALLHRYGALSFWDYATAGPYVSIDMNPLVTGEDQPYVYKDAIFISTHKFVGGVQTPGILVAKKKLFQNPVPTNCGGGTVLFVRKETHTYHNETELREEGGTPAIVESIRAGLVFQLKDAITHDVIMKRELILYRKGITYMKQVPNLIVLGPHLTDHLPIFSIMIKHQESGLFLHYKYVSTLLNDVFGIQTRGGCACAGPYTQSLLGMSDEVIDEIEKNLSLKGEILRPGFVRLNLPYFMDDVTVDYILEAVRMVAEHGWKMLPQYQYNADIAEWRHNSVAAQKSFNMKQLAHISYDEGHMTLEVPSMPEQGEPPESLQACLVAAHQLFLSCKTVELEVNEHALIFENKCEKIRWFLLPHEAYMCLHNPQRVKRKRWKTLQFEPIQYPKDKYEHTN